jgi:hypothetical protein
MPMAFAQTVDSYDYQSEFTWGINKNTSGGLIGGFVFKKANKLGDRLLRTYGVELMNVKHPMELRANSGNGDSYIFGKSNYLYAVRLQYGYDIILFKKAAQQGVEIKGVFAAGPSIGVVSPYYVRASVGNGTKTISVPYNKAPDDAFIAGAGPPFKGLKDATITPGLNFKTGLNFELGTIKSQVTGFEAGFLLDAYSKKIELMHAVPDNYSVFPTLYFTVFYGNRR